VIEGGLAECLAQAIAIAFPGGRFERQIVVMNHHQFGAALRLGIVGSIGNDHALSIDRD
jgi:hypothetical protein